MEAYSSANEFGLYFVGQPDEDDKSTYALKRENFPELAAYAEKENISGFIWLEMKKCPEGYYVPVIPE